MYIKAGVEQKSVCFMLMDNQISQEFFLEGVNNLLSSGEIVNLVSKEEME